MAASPPKQTVQNKPKAHSIILFVMFRIYGPQKEAVDGSWILNDIEQVN
jgi:hypothetical protein